MTTFEEAALEVLASRGVTIDANGRYVRLPGGPGPNSATEAQVRYMNERRRTGDVNGRLEYGWVTGLVEACDALMQQREAAPWPFRTAFWIRLHGVLSDLRLGCLGLFRRLEVDPATCQANPGSLLALELEKFRCIEAIRQRFTEDELIYADYLRQTHGHPTQDAYEVRWSNANGGQVNDRRAISTIGREFTTAELTEAIRRVLDANKVNGRIDERLIATRFAERVRAVAEPLVAIMLQLGTPG